ncbi:hypothetical protein [Acinetobacter bereziniae]|uniref:hypothetical protein n=1 Tax=Acinetobacter bereziniae TaxID=106648 RepID=UPI003AF7D321
MNNIQEGNYFYKVIESRSFSEFSDVKSSCLLILDYLMIAGRDQEVTFYFDELREKVDEQVSDNDFILSVFYLTRSDVQVLEQSFSAWHSLSGFRKKVKKELVNKMMKSKNFSHPFSGEKLTEEEFYNAVIPYFVVTQFFLDHKNDKI